MPNTNTDTSIVNIKVKSIYSPDERTHIAERLSVIRKHLNVGMRRFHAEVTNTVDNNNCRIQKPDGIMGLYTGQISERNMRHFFSGVRSADAKVQILHAYLEIVIEREDTS